MGVDNFRAEMSVKRLRAIEDGNDVVWTEAVAWERREAEEFEQVWSKE